MIGLLHNRFEEKYLKNNRKSLTVYRVNMAIPVPMYNNMVFYCFLSHSGWYIVWVAFLSRFKLMRELLSRGDNEGQSKQNDQTTVADSNQRKSKTRTRRRRVAEEEENYED